MDSSAMLLLIGNDSMLFLVVFKWLKILREGITYSVFA